MARLVRILAVLGVVMVGGSTAVMAAPITITVTGTVASSPFGSTILNGDPFSLTYTFESTTGARVGSNATFAYYDALTALAFTAGSYSGSSAGASEIQVDNNPPLPDGDRYAVVSTTLGGLSGPTLGGYSLSGVGFRLDDNTRNLFASALTLPTQLNLNDFSSNAFFIFFTGDLNPSFVVVSGTLTTLQTAPEPTALALVALGLAAGARRIRRRAGTR